MNKIIGNIKLAFLGSLDNPARDFVAIAYVLAAGFVFTWIVMVFGLIPEVPRLSLWAIFFVALSALLLFIGWLNTNKKKRAIEDAAAAFQARRRAHWQKFVEDGEAACHRFARHFEKHYTDHPVRSVFSQFLFRSQVSIEDLRNATPCGILFVQKEAWDLARALKRALEEERDDRRRRRQFAACP